MPNESPDGHPAEAKLGSDAASVAMKIMSRLFADAISDIPVARYPRRNLAAAMPDHPSGPFRPP